MPRLTRRQSDPALRRRRRRARRLRPGAAARGTRPRALVRARPSPPPAPQAVAAGTRPRCSAPRGRFDLVGLALGARRTGSRRRCARAAAAAAGRAGRALHDAGDHGPDGGTRDGRHRPGLDRPGGRVPAAPARARPRPARHASCAPARPRARSPRVRRGARQVAGRAADHPARRLGRRQRRRRAPTPRTARSQLAFVHHTVNANDYGPEDSAGIVLGHRALPPRPQRLERHRLQLPRRPLRPDLRGPRGRDRPAIVGAQAQGFNSVSTGVACIGDVHRRRRQTAALDALARLIGWKLSLHGVPVAGQRRRSMSAGGASNRYPAGTPVTFERDLGPSRRQRDGVPGRRALRASCRRCASRAGAVRGPAVRAHAEGVRDEAARRHVGEPGGTLRFADGSSPAGAPVDILYATAGGAYSPIAHRPLRRRRPVEHGGRPAAAPGAVGARFPRRRARAPLESRSLRITVVPKLALALSSRRIRRRRRARVSGVVTPATDGSVGSCSSARSAAATAACAAQRRACAGGRFLALLPARARRAVPRDRARVGRVGAPVRARARASVPVACRTTS